MVLKLWATHEMNLWEREIQGALEWNLIFLTWQFWGSARYTNQYSNKCFSQNTFNLDNVKSHSDTYILYRHWVEHLTPIFIQKELISRLSGIWTCLANVNMWVKFLSRHSEVFKICTKYLSCLVYNQVYNMFVCTLCPCLSSFPQNWGRLQRNPRALDVSSWTLLRESRLRYITWHTGRTDNTGTSSTWDS